MGQQQSSGSGQDGKHRHRWRSSKNNSAEAGGGSVQGTESQPESKRASGVMGSLMSRVGSRPVSLAGVPPSLQPGHGGSQGQAAAAQGSAGYAGRGSGSSSATASRQQHAEQQQAQGQTQARTQPPAAAPAGVAAGMNGASAGAVAGAAGMRPEMPAGEQPVAFPQPQSNQGPQYKTDMPASSAPATVPCQYRTGKTLGSGTYAIVKEAVHIKSGQFFACKVINKKLMEGREYMVRNEISVLKRVSKGHPNIVTLHDYFETAHNLYLVFDLCTGGELFDRICAKGNYYEQDAADLVRTIMKAVKHIHESGIVHRDLKPENLLFRTKAEDADIMIADFGLSRVMEEEKLKMLTEICGTPGYMAPEIFKKTGHGKPVDIWAMGVITYFLLCGYTPFDRDTQQEEMEAIIAGDYKFEPEEYWSNVSKTAKDFVRYCLTVNPNERPTAQEALDHKWLQETHFVQDRDGNATNLLPQIQKAFDARKTFRKAVFSMMAMKRMSTLASGAGKLSPEARQLGQDIAQYKEESEKEIVDEDNNVMHYGTEHSSTGGTPPTSPHSPEHALEHAVAQMSIDVGSDKADKA